LVVYLAREEKVQPDLENKIKTRYKEEGRLLDDFAAPIPS